MRRDFYEEPDIEIHTFYSKDDVRTIDGDLTVSTEPKEDGDFDYGDIY